MRRWLKRVGRVLLVLAAMTMALLVGVWVFVTTPPGERMVRDRLVQALDEALPGNVEIGTLDLSLRELIVEDIALRDPEGEVVARIGRLQVVVDLGSIVRRRLVLPLVRIEDLAADVVQDERGLNLVRAVHKVREELGQPTRPLDLTVEVKRFELLRSNVRLRQSTTEALAEDLRLNALEAKGAVTFETLSSRLRGQLALDGHFTEPLEAPLSLRADFDHAARSTDVDATLGLADLALESTLKGAPEKDALTLAVQSLTLPHETVRAFVPVWPLLADADVKGTLGQDGNWYVSDLRLGAGEATAEVKGRVDVARLRAEGLDVQARGVDLSKLVENGPASDLALSLTGNVQGTSLQTLQGELSLRMPTSTIDGHPFGPVSLQAQASEGTFALSELDVRVPGAQLTGGGEGTLERLRFDGKFTASDLGLLGRTLGRVVRPEGLPLSGRGELTVGLQGPLDGPGLHARGRFSSLRWEDVRVTGLGIDAKVGDVRRPLDADARLRIDTLRLGERQFQDVRGDVVTRGRNLSADLTARGLAEVGLRVQGLLDEDRHGLRIDGFALRYPEARWSLERPAHLRFADGDLRLEPLWLQSERQRLGVDGTLLGNRLDVRAAVENFALTGLPPALLPSSLADGTLGGEVSARVNLGGTTARPTVEAQVQLRNGSWQKFEDMGLELAARYADDQVEGRIRLLALASQVEGTFTLPVSGLLNRSRKPLRADLAIAPTRLESLFSSFGLDPGLSGSAAATIQVEGSAAEPRVRIVVDGDEVRQREGPPGDLNVIVESSEEGPLVVRIDLTTMGSQSFFLARTPWVAGQFLTGPVTGRMFIEEPVEAEASFRQVPLAAAHAWGLIPAKLDGTVSISLQANGPIRSPQGKLHVTVRDAAAEGLSPVDAYATVTAGEDSVRSTLAVLRGPQRLVDLEATLGGSLGELFARADPTTIEMLVDGQVGPVRLTELQALLEPESEEPQPAQRLRPDGVITSVVNLRGNLDNPKGLITAHVDRLGIGDAAVGKVDLDLRYGDGRAHTQVQLTSAKGGRLGVDGSAQVDLSASGLFRGVDWGQVPVKARIEANAFDPSFLSGVTALVREVGGRIDGSARIEGPLFAPEFRGRLAWEDGRVALMGFGQYRNVQLRLRGTNEALVLENFSLQSGGGRAQVAVRADRQGDLYQLSGDGVLEQFPLVFDDQLQAILSGRFGISGEASRAQLFVRNLSIPELHVELPEVRRKDLQPLERPDDVILVRRGEPLYKRRAQQVAGGSGTAGAPLPPPGEGPSAVTILINAPRNLWVRGTDVNAELGLSEDFRVELGERTLVFGEVRVARGRVDVLGRRFDVLRDSQVRFAGPPAAPYINLTAEHTNERESVAVFTTVRGQGRDITLRVSSTPSLSESEIYTLLATGRRTLRRGSGASMSGSEAASVVGAYYGSQFRRLISAKLPIDVLSIEAGQQGLADASVEAGTYLGGRVYFGWVGRLGARPERNENAYGFRLEYQLTPRWNFETEYGSARVGGADFMWSRDY